VWLRDASTVVGDIVYRARGNLGFLAEAEGAQVHGDVLLGAGLLWANGASTTNRIHGDLTCHGGRPKNGSGSGSDWDGLDGDIDGSLDGAYSC
jgi:hypothetical protein